jgi:hypothetical protein
MTHFCHDHRIPNLPVGADPHRSDNVPILLCNVLWDGDYAIRHLAKK